MNMDERIIIVLIQITYSESINESWYVEVDFHSALVKF